MDYFSYNETRSGSPGDEETQYEVLTFNGDETIEVDEDHTVTVDDVRKYLRSMHESDTPELPNVVRIRAV